MKTVVIFLLVVIFLFGGAERPQGSSEPSTLTFTLETTEKTVQFLEPIAIRVVLHNNSRSSISLNTDSLRIIADNWHVVGSGGAWSGSGEGKPLQAEGGETSGRIDLPAGASLRLLHVHEDANVEQLGPMRVGFKLSSTDAATKRLLPTDLRYVSFDIPPTKLLSAVWAAQTQTDRERTQPIFNEFLRFRAAAAAAAALEKDGGDFHQELRNNTHAIKTLFYMAGYALPFLFEAAKDQDPFIREQSIPAYSYAARAIDQLDAYLDELDALGPRPQWASTLRKNHNRDLADWRSFALRALNDPAPNVRIAAVSVLTKTDWNQYGFDVLQHSIGTPKSQAQQSDDEHTVQEFNAVKTLSTDRDAGVRAAVQKYLASLSNKDFATDTVVEALIDPDPTVRQNALNALLRSPEPPPRESIKRAFASAKGDTAIGLIPLLLEQEDSTLPATLGKGFLQRSEAERLAIMTAIAGHSDSHALDLIKSALSDASPEIQRAALLRLLAFPSATASPLLDSYLRSGSIQQRRLAEAVWTEIEKRSRWPFLKRATSASETVFPSRNGTTPLTSPDGQWIAYVETGWGRPGGSGGFGRSNLISISHVVRNDGTDDRVVSDMFLVAWLSDSKRVGTARDAFVAISDFDGNVVGEFGDRSEEQFRGNAKPHWTKGDLRSQFGQHMPHQKRLKGTEDFGFGEGGAFSPDGKWYGPLQDSQGAFFLGVAGPRMPIKISNAFSRRDLHAKWSPDGRFVQLDGVSTWLIIDMQTQDSTQIPYVDDSIFPGDFGSTRCRGNPWSRDSTALVFVRNGQIWVSDARGKAARQLTFDSTRKAFPIFSRDGRSVAYLTWQPDNRRHYDRLGPTNLWVVEVESTLAIRVTARATGRINSFDWLDDHTLIFDRYEQADDAATIRLSPASSLRRLSLD